MECKISEDRPTGHGYIGMNPPTLYWPVFQFHWPNPVYKQAFLEKKSCGEELWILYKYETI